MKQYKEDIDAKLTFYEDIKLPVVLLANKMDTSPENFNKKQVDAFCQENGFAGWFETSAKLGTNIDKATKFLVQQIMEHRNHFASKRIEEVID